MERLFRPHLSLEIGDRIALPSLASTAQNGMYVVAIFSDDMVGARFGRHHHTVSPGFLAGIKMLETTDFSLHICFVATFIQSPRVQHTVQQPFFYQPS
ncbi:hypothetical protein [Kaarinaea lacus]